MAIKEQYINKWRRLNRKSRVKVKVEDICFVEYEHSVITKQMEESIAYIEKKIMACVKQKDNDGKWDIIKDLQYRIIVRPLENGKYALISGRLPIEVFRRFGISTAMVYVTDAESKEEFIKMLKKTMTINTMMPVKAIAKSSATVTEEEINNAMAYLMKNKNFEKQMVLDPFTYKVIKEPVNLYVAERIGLVDVEVRLESK